MSFLKTLHVFEHQENAARRFIAVFLTSMVSDPPFTQMTMPISRAPGSLLLTARGA
jgi:hypothetical protein